MGKAVSKDGWITNATEVMPFGGFATTSMQAARENGKEAVREVACRISNSGASVIGLEITENSVVAMVSMAGVEIPFTYVNSQNQPESLFVTPCSRPFNYEKTTFISMKAMVFVNRWGFALSADDNGNLSHHNRYRQRDGW
jgi:hypothetical protein